MKAVYRDARYFKDVVKGLSLWFDEATFQMTPEGLFLKQMDSSRVFLGKLELPKYDFEEFEADVERYFTINIEYLVKEIFKNVYKDDQVILRLSEDRLLISLKSDMERKFSVPLLENPEELEIPEPKLSFTSIAKLTVEGLSKILEDAKADHVRLVADSDGLTFTSDSDLVDYSVKLERGQEHLLDIETHEPFVKASYSVNWLKSIVKALKPVSDVVTLRFGNDLPMEIQTFLRSSGKLTVYLAPRIEVEEEPLEREEKEEPEPIEEEVQEPIETEPSGEVQEKPTDITPQVFFTEVVFIKEVLEITDLLTMKTYGPFKEGTRVQIPVRNAEALIKQGLAVSWYMWNMAKANWKEHNPNLSEPSIEELKPYLS